MTYHSNEGIITVSGSVSVCVLITVLFVIALICTCTCVAYYNVFCAFTELCCLLCGVIDGSIELFVFNWLHWPGMWR